MPFCIFEEVLSQNEMVIGFETSTRECFTLNTSSTPSK